MKFTLTIEADSFDEIDSLFHQNRTSPPALGDAEAERVNYNDSAQFQVSGEEAPPAKKRGRGAKAAPSAEEPASSTTEGTGPADASADKVSFEDIRTKASALMDSGKVDGRALQEMLLSKFEARAFTALKQEQYAACLAELDNLAA